MKESSCSLKDSSEYNKHQAACPSVIARKDIPELKSVVKDGIEYTLGSHQDFKNNPKIKDFMEGVNQLSISWTHLAPGEVLKVHTHPTKSMIVVCQGSGELSGYTNKSLNAGDIVIIPENTDHGFTGAGGEGMYALSIQFEEHSLYARGRDANVTFVPESEVIVNAEQVYDFNSLKKYNQKKMDEFSKIRFFSAMENGTYDNPLNRQMFMNCLQYWSNIFQDIVLLRKVTSKNKMFTKIADEHLEEEIGHNKLLLGREGAQDISDPILHATSQWWPYQMLIMDNIEKSVLVHMVLEASGTEFHRHANKVFKSEVQSNYFDLHEECDEGHSELADHLLMGHPPEMYANLACVLDEGWEMLSALFERILLLVEENSKKKVS